MPQFSGSWTVFHSIDFSHFRLYDDRMGSRSATGSRAAFDGFRLSLILVPCLLFMPELLGLSRFAGWDISRLNLPLKWFDVQSIREGAIPLWNHYLYAGMPHLAESESGLFYPGNILLHLPGDFFYWASLTIIGHLVLAGLFCDLWLRGRGIRREISFFGAVLFQTAPFLLFHITSMALLQAVVWFPLLLWLADRILEEPRPRAIRFLIGALGLMGGMLMLVGSAQMAFYEGFLLSFYLLGHVLAAKDHWKQRLGRSVGALAVMGLGALLIGAVIWIPTQEFTAITIRETVGKNFYLLGTWLTPSRLATAFYFPAYGRPAETVGWASSLFYVGLVPTLLAMFRLAGIKVNWRRDAPLIVMFGVALFLAFGMNNPLNHLLVKFPPFSLFRYQGRIAIGVLMALIALGGHWLSDVYWKPLDDKQQGEGPDPARTKTMLKWCLVIVFACLLAFLLNAHRSTAIKWGGIVFVVDVLLGWWAFASLLRNRGSRRFPLWLAVYMIFHLAIVYPVGRFATMKTETYREALTFFDRLERSDGLPPRLLIVDVGKFEDRDLLALNLLGPQDSLPNLCAGNTAVFAGVQTLDPYTPLRPVEWNRIIRREIVSGFEESSEDGILDSVTANLLHVLGIDAVVTCGDVNDIPGYELVSEDLEPAFGSGTRLYMAEIERPRVWMADEMWGDEGFSYELTLLRNGARVELATDTGGPCMVEISHSPNWDVKLDGRPAVLSQAGGVFAAIEIPDPGDHVIEFEYRTDSFRRGAILSIAGVVILAMWILAMWMLFALQTGKNEKLQTGKNEKPL